MSKEIALTRGKFALVDDADYEWLSQWKWLCTTAGYACRRTWAAGRDVTILIHREIMSPPPGMRVDHVNHDTLDNRRINLRIATPGQNLQNQLPTRGGASVFKGVSIHNNRWIARIQRDGKYLRLGRFLTQREAAAAYNAAAIAIYGEFAYLNDLSLLPDHLDVPIVPWSVLHPGRPHD